MTCPALFPLQPDPPRWKATRPHGRAQFDLLEAADSCSFPSGTATVESFERPYRVDIPFLRHGFRPRPPAYCSNTGSLVLGTTETQRSLATGGARLQSRRPQDQFRLSHADPPARGLGQFGSSRRAFSSSFRSSSRTPSTLRGWSLRSSICLPRRAQHPQKVEPSRPDVAAGKHCVGRG